MVRSSGRGLRHWCATTVAALALAGCWSVPASGPPSSNAPVPPGPATSSGSATDQGQVGDSLLRATATASTLFDTQRTFRLELTNASSTEVAVRGLQLESPLYEEVAVTRRTLRLAPDQQVLVPLPYGTAICVADGAADLGSVVVDTGSGRVSVPLGAHPQDLVATRHAAECTVTATRQAVDIAFADGWQRVAPRRAAGELVVTPRAADTQVGVTDVAGNIIFGTRVADALPVDARDQQVRLGVEVSANRCDTHALIESKTTFVYGVEVTVDDRPSVVVDVEPTGATRALFQSLLEACLDETA